MTTPFKIVGMGLTAALMAAVMAAEALAEAVGVPVPGQLGLQPAATPVMHDLRFFHDWVLMPIITAITLLVLLLLVYVGIRFRKAKNPTPSRVSHNTTIEVLWTVIPILILVIIAIPSFRLLYFQRVIPPADITIKATGHQWYWSYEYMDLMDTAEEPVYFVANMVEEADLQPGQPRLLATDYDMVVPVNRVVKLLVTASDVIHSWTIPAFGIKIDAIPGRNNEDWFRAEQTGIYYGQCSELCGIRHAFMPIAVRVVSQEDYDAWAETARTAGVDEANQQLAQRLQGNAQLAEADRAGNKASNKN